jgi:hypothetical protein
MTLHIVRDVALHGAQVRRHYRYERAGKLKHAGQLWTLHDGKAKNKHSAEKRGRCACNGEQPLKGAQCGKATVFWVALMGCRSASHSQFKSDNTEGPG